MMWNQVTGSGYMWSAYIKGSSMVVPPVINYEEEAAPIPFMGTDYGHLSLWCCSRWVLVMSSSFWNIDHAFECKKVTGRINN